MPSLFLSTLLSGGCGETVGGKLEFVVLGGDHNNVVVFDRGYCLLWGDLIREV